MKRALLLVSHGSRVEQANQEVAALTLRLAQASSKQYAVVTYGFLEIAQPDFPSSIETCMAQGVQELVVVPYFLAAGRHVRDDVPQRIADAKARHPEVEIRLSAYLGTAEGLPQLLLQLAAEETDGGAV